MKRGDFVWIEYGSQRIRAMVVIASRNGKSLGLMFDGWFCGYMNMMPVLMDEDGIYRGVRCGKAFIIRPMGPDWEA